MPAALAGRGFQPEDRATLFMVTEDNNVLFPILGPDDRIYRIKCRLGRHSASGRYFYRGGGSGTPAWCSPCFTSMDTVLVIEGELNGMISWLALDGSISVMGVAGTSGKLWLEPLQGRTVYVYGDGDAAGQAARQRWARAAYTAGAEAVHVVEPWSDGDACDIAGTLGVPALRERLS